MRGLCRGGVDLATRFRQLFLRLLLLLAGQPRLGLLDQLGDLLLGGCWRVGDAGFYGHGA